MSSIVEKDYLLEEINEMGMEGLSAEDIVLYCMEEIENSLQKDKRNKHVLAGDIGLMRKLKEQLSNSKTTNNDINWFDNNVVINLLCKKITEKIRENQKQIELLISNKDNTKENQKQVELLVPNKDNAKENQKVRWLGKVTDLKNLFDLLMKHGFLLKDYNNDDIESFIASNFSLLPSEKKIKLSSERIEKFCWKGTNAQIVHLFDLLEQKKLISSQQSKYALIMGLFVNKSEKNFVCNTLRTSKHNAKNINKTSLPKDSDLLKDIVDEITK